MSIFVSGAAGGIGKGACTVLKSRGEHVIGQDLVGGEFVSPNMIGDLRSADFIERIERTLSAGLQDGSLTGVVAAHGVSGAGRLSEIGRARAETIMEINFESVVTLFEKVRAPLEKSGVLLSSSSARRDWSERRAMEFIALRSLLYRGGSEVLPKRLQFVCAQSIQAGSVRRCLTMPCATWPRRSSSPTRS